MNDLSKHRFANNPFTTKNGWIKSLYKITSSTVSEFTNNKLNYDVDSGTWSYTKHKDYNKLFIKSSLKGIAFGLGKLNP